MSKNKNVNANVIDGFLRSDKWILLVTLALAGVVDVILSVYAIYSGLTLLIVQAILALVANLVLILATIKSNFRFSYSRIAPFIYVIITIALTVFSALIYANVIFENTALISFIITHGICVVAVIISTFNASKLGNGFKLVSLITLLATFGVSTYYSAYVLTNGYFGQGGFGYKNVSYEYVQATDSYVAVETMGAGGKKIVIPNERNGKKVTKLNANVFNDGALEEIYLNAGADVEIQSVTSITDNLNKNLKIYTDKTVVDEFKNKFKLEVKNAGSANSYYVSLMNKVVPTNLGENERFISFDYTVESLVYADYQIIKTWIGNKNDTFSLIDHAGDIEYVSAFKDKDETYLKECFDNDKLALQSLTFDGKDVNGLTVYDDMAHVKVDFENVYAIKIVEDNDLLYEPSNEFKQLGNSGYRYVVKSYKNSLINSLDAREGFTVSWKKINGSSEIAFVNLDTVLGSEKTITIAPVWALNKPKINSASASGNGVYVYGDNFELNADVTAPVENYNLSYNWSFVSSDGATTLDSVGNANLVAFNNVLPSLSGEYKVDVTAYSDTETSLTSKSNQTISVTVNKKTLGFNWDIPTDKVYSATEKVVSATYETTDVINSDVIEFDFISDKPEIKNAGEYNFSVKLKGDADTKYVIDANDVNNSLTIKKRKLNVVWETSNFIYNGNVQLIKALSLENAIPSEEWELLSGLTYSGYGKNANTYKILASLTHANYELDGNKTAEYVINPKEVTLSFTDLEFTYDGLEHHPTAIASGIVDNETQNDLALTYNGAKKDAGNDYVITVAVGNPNYLLTGETSATYDIKQKELDVIWSETTKTYNGKEQYPTADVASLVFGESLNVLELVYTGGGTNVGNYTVSVAIGKQNSNYKLVSGTTTNLTINPKTLNVTWGSNSFVYNGNAQRPTYGISGFVNGETESVLNLVVSNGNIDAGSYDAMLSINNDNYFVDSAETVKSYSISKKQVQVSWGNSSLVYNGEAQSPTATLVGLVNGETESSVYFTVSGKQTNVGDSYTATATISSNNYNISQGREKTYKITAKQIDLVWSNLQFTYDKTAKTPTVESVNGLVGGQTVSVLNLTVQAGGVNVGTYTATATISNSNYKLSNATCIYEIKAKEVTLVWANTEFTYDKIAKKPTVESVNGLVGGDDISVLNLNVTGEKVNVGIYTATATCNNKNYKVTNATCQFEIAKKELVLTFNIASEVEYTGSAINVDVTSSAGDVPLNVEYYKNGAPCVAPIDVGTYTVKVTINDGNYVLVGVTEKQFTIVETEGGEDL